MHKIHSLTPVEFVALAAKAAKEEAKERSKWSKQWPTEPGKYWFYGERFFGYAGDALRFVEVYAAKGGVSCICGGTPIYESEAKGVWQPVVVPELPREGEA